MQHLRVAVAAAVLSSVVPSEGAANDRLPKRYRAPYEVGLGQSRKYVRYLLNKVWTSRLVALKAQHTDPKQLRARVEEAVDEIVEVVLPQNRKIAEDVLFGTGQTHLRITLPERHKLAQGAGKRGPNGKPASAGEMVQQAIDQVGGTFERALTDRIEQALAEDLEDLVQREVEGDLGLPVVGRPRELPRPLPPRWEKRYAKARADVHTYDYWWLRKKRRMQLLRLAVAHSPAELDRARHDGRIWGLISAASQETWAQNRLRLDFGWGRLNWQIDRRRIRRRMDQDLAQGTWALAKLVKELTAPDTTQAIRRFLDQRVEEELSKPPLKQKAEEYPTSARELEKALGGIQEQLNPVLNRAMDRAELPDLTGDLRELAREHGRRYAREDLSGDVSRAIQRKAAPMAAAKRVRARLGALVRSSLNRLDAGRSGESADAQRRRALQHVRKDVDPFVDEEIETALRDGGRDHELLGKDSRSKAVGDVRRAFGIDGEIEQEVERVLGKGQ